MHGEAVDEDGQGVPVGPFPAACCLADHARLLRRDIGASRRAEIEDDGAIGLVRPLGNVPVDKAAHVLGERDSERGGKRARASAWRFKSSDIWVRTIIVAPLCHQ